jgi:Domain of unknown function (DUF4037)
VESRVIEHAARPSIDQLTSQVEETSSMRHFVPGIELNRDFYSTVVGPILAGSTHAAGLLGWGSDVLGFDDERSTDHGWGLRLVVFVEASQVEGARELIDQNLPVTFRDWPVRYGWDAVPVQHHVSVSPLDGWLEDQLGFGVGVRSLTTEQWLLAPQQRLLGITKGAVYHDGVGDLTRIRSQLAAFPDDVWMWMLAAQWQRIAQEEAFVGRTIEAGDQLGSLVVCGRLARELMRLWFLLHRTYWPYTKWFGSAFSRLPDASSLSEPLATMLSAPDGDVAQRALAVSLEVAARKHNELALSAHVDPSVRNFHSRPFQVLQAERFAEACIARVTDPRLRDAPLIGSIDQWVDSTDVLENPERTSLTGAVYAWRPTDERFRRAL